MTTIAPLPHDLAVAAALSTLNRPIGYATAPNGALAAVQAAPHDLTKVYVIIYPLDGGGRDGSLSDPYADGVLPYQFTVVGGRPDLVQNVVGQLEAALAAVDVPGREVLAVVPAGFGGVREDTDVTPRVFFATPRYEIHTTPA